MREIKFSYIQQHDETGRMTDSRLTLQQIEALTTGSVTYRGYTLVARRQFTGLLDKNDNEIYEGDIVQLRVNKHIWIYRIGCNEYDGVNLYAINVRDNVTIDDETDTYSYRMTDVRAGLSRPIPQGCEVIGNIYENPELLKLDIPL